MISIISFASTVCERSTVNILLNPVERLIIWYIRWRRPAFLFSLACLLSFSSPFSPSPLPTSVPGVPRSLKMTLFARLLVVVAALPLAFAHFGGESSCKSSEF